MKAFAIDELGQPGSVRDIAIPEPGEGQVRIRVVAAGLNPFDSAVVRGYLKGRMEHRFPLVPGMDASGTVEALGDGVPTGEWGTTCSVQSGRCIWAREPWRTSPPWRRGPWQARGGVGSYLVGAVTTASLEALASMLEHGEIQAPELQSFPLADAQEALTVVGSGHVRGKIVVVPA